MGKGLEDNLVYADTSVFGGVLDRGNELVTQRFFDQVRAGSLKLALSTLVLQEVVRAPRPIRDLVCEMEEYALRIRLSENAIRLQEAYLSAGILTSKWRVDALHVALASCEGCDLLLSWNFSHIVHHQKMPLFNAVNRLRGYNELAIRSPNQVITYGD